MIDQLLNEIEETKTSLAEWQRREREAAQATQRLRGYLDGLVRALELAQSDPVASGEAK